MFSFVFAKQRDDVRYTKNDSLQSNAIWYSVIYSRTVHEIVLAKPSIKHILIIGFAFFQPWLYVAHW
jgi:hypothetical protein